MSLIILIYNPQYTFKLESEYRIYRIAKLLGSDTTLRELYLVLIIMDEKVKNEKLQECIISNWHKLNEEVQVLHRRQGNLRLDPAYIGM